MSEPTANEQTELDDWAAAMAEQAAATQQDTTNVVNGSSETRSAQPAAAAVFHELARDHVTRTGARILI